MSITLSDHDEFQNDKKKGGGGDVNVNIDIYGVTVRILDVIKK